MRVVRILIFTVIGGTIGGAQNSAPAIGGLTITPIVGNAKYCMGPTSYFPQEHQPGVSDITLRLSLKVLYENHGAEPMILPLRFRSVVRMFVAGGTSGEVVTSRVDPLDQDAIKAQAQPDPPYFLVIPGGGSELAYLGELVDLRVRSPSRVLLGRTLQFSITRDHGLLPSSLFEELRNKWRAYGTLWNGVRDSKMFSVSVPEAPVTVDCRKDERF
jgi:hypothetical protein